MPFGCVPSFILERVVGPDRDVVTVTDEPVRRPRPPLTIRAGARPFEITVMSGGLIAGTFGVLSDTARSAVIERAFPGWWTTAWYISLIFWCGLALYAIIPQAAEAVRYGWSALTHPRGQARLSIRLRLEQAAMIGFSGSVFAYGVSALVYNGATALTAAIWIGLFGVASIARSVEIYIDLRKLAYAHRYPLPAFPTPIGDPGRVIGNAKGDA